MEEEKKVIDLPKKNESILKIVVVDDSDFSRASVIETLDDHGYDVVGQASSAEEGVALSGNAEANLFIIDVIMPERSGIEMAKILSDSSSSARMIMMSSLNMEKIVIESISAGAVDFLPKPFTSDDLIKAVKKVETELTRD